MAEMLKYLDYFFVHYYLVYQKIVCYKKICSFEAPRFKVRNEQKCCLKM